MRRLIAIFALATAGTAVSAQSGHADPRDMACPIAVSTFGLQHQAWNEQSASALWAFMRMNRSEKRDVAAITLSSAGLLASVMLDPVTFAGSGQDERSVNSFDRDVLVPAQPDPALALAEETTDRELARMYFLALRAADCLKPRGAQTPDGFLDAEQTSRLEQFL